MSNSKRENKGRYETPAYVKAIQARFEENFPDNTPKEFIIDHCLKYFWQHVEDQLRQEIPLDVFAFGKFTCQGKVSKMGNFQYYPRFKFSRHFLLRVREFKGTLTASEQREVEAKRAFMEKVWEGRRAYILETRGKIHPTLEKRFKDLGTPQPVP